MKQGLFLLLTLLAAIGCKKASDQREPVPDGIVVAKDRLVIRHGALGMDGAMRGTYVLVDIENRTPELRAVTADGVLEDTAGNTVGELGYDEVIIPPSSSRTFALTAGLEHRDATNAEVRVRDARKIDPPPFQVGDVRLGDSTTGGKVLTATIINRHKRAAVANVLASFHSPDGTILERPWQRLLIPPKSSKEIRFPAPPNAAKGDVYPGDVIY